MSMLASQITGDSSICLAVCLDLDQRKQQSTRYWPFVRGIHLWPGIPSPRASKAEAVSTFDDVIMI